MAIIQQEFQHDPWKMLIGCIMLNQTGNKNVRKVIYSFFDKWPSPQSVLKADENEIREHIRTLGFCNVRTQRIIRFSHEYINKKFSKANELYGIGKYADDSYEILRGLAPSPGPCASACCGLVIIVVLQRVAPKAA
jgi:methyl-CpG-binding domain protein 4